MRIYFFMILFVFLHQKQCFAGAWIQKKQETQLINQIFLTHSDLHSRKYDGKNAETTLDTGSYNAYLEHGLTNRMTIGVNLFASMYRVNNLYDNTTKNTNGINFTEFFIKRSILSTTNSILSLQILTKLHGDKIILQNNSEGYPVQNDHEIKMMFGYGYNGTNGNLIDILSINDFFLDFGLAYRVRQNLPFNEIRMEISIGYNIIPKEVFLLGQIFRINNIYTKKQNQNLINSGNSFKFMSEDLTKIMLSLLWKYDDQIVLQFGLIQDIYGKMIGKGDNSNRSRGMFVGFMMNFN